MSLDSVSTTNLTKAFESFDLDTDGELSRAEFSKLCHHMGHHFSPSQLIEAFNFLATQDGGTRETISLAKFLHWWDAPSGRSSGLRIGLAMDSLRNSFSKKTGIFFGFTFDQWKKATLLDPTKVMSWNVKDVLLAMATSPQLQVCRSYLLRENWTDVDGETLLALTVEDLKSKGVKAYHCEKFLRFVSSLRIQVDNPTHSLHTSPTKRSLAPLKRAPPKGVHAPGASKQHSNSTSKSKTSRSNSLIQDEIGTQWKKGQLIGRGSFGSVYMVLNETNGRFMAMKEVELGFKNDAEEVKALVSEISLLQQLNHPNIVRYLGSRIQPATSCIQIFTEWIPGGSIRSILDNFGPLSSNVVRSYVHQALEGLVYLHDHRIWHRDIKGANILVTDGGQIKLADFGTSEKLRKENDSQNKDDQSTGINTTCGTPLFMAPEAMLEPKTVDGLKADIWSLGATALQMVTGSPPWKEHNFNNFMQLMMRVADDSKMTPVIKETVPPALRDFLGQCFRRNPTLRPSARQLCTHPFFGKTFPIRNNSSGTIATTNGTTSNNTSHSSSIVQLPPLSIDNGIQPSSPHSMSSNLQKIMDDTEGYHHIQSYLEDSARDSHSSFHRSSSTEDEGDKNIFETGDISLMSKTIEEQEERREINNPFASGGVCEDLTATGIHKKLSGSGDI